MTVIVSADPGTSGCIAAICSTRGVLDIARVPVVNRSKSTQGRAVNFVDAAGLRDILRQWSSAHRFAAESVSAVCEQVGAHPGLSPYASLQMGYAAGVIEAVLATTIAPVHMVQPREWKSHFGLGSDKRASVEVARRLYPDLPTRCGHDKAEAVLIAHWMMSQVNGEARAA